MTDSERETILRAREIDTERPKAGKRLETGRMPFETGRMPFEENEKQIERQSEKESAPRKRQKGRSRPDVCACVSVCVHVYAITRIFHYKQIFRLGGQCSIYNCSDQCLDVDTHVRWTCCECVHKHICTYIYMYTYVYIYLCIYTHTYICICAYV